MEPVEYLDALRKRWYVIALLAALFGAFGFYQATTSVPLYRSSSSVYVTLSAAENVGELVQGTTYTQNLIQSYALLARTPAVLDLVIDDLGLETTPRLLAGSVTADIPLNSYVIEITSVSDDAEEAAAISNSVAANLATTVARLSPQTAEGAQAVRLETVTPATPPGYPFSPNTRLTVATWFAIGAAVGLVLALARAVLDTRLRRADDIARVTDTPVLGTIPRIRRGARGPMVVSDEPLSTGAEAYRKLRTNLQFLDAGQHVKSIVVTSSMAREGKSTTALNLALALAETNERVLLIDADLRRPSVAAQTGIVDAVGLTTVLIGQATMDEVIQSFGVPNLDVLASGEAPPNPSQLIDSEAMVEVLADARARYDYVVIDAPPSLPVADPAIMARHADGALVVVNSRATTRHQLQQSLSNLAAVDAVALGVVVVGVGHSDGLGYYGPATTRRGFLPERLVRPQREPEAVGHPAGHAAGVP
ncbi:capsular exopolysaccharide family [Beutenbergia cavernae DSM 12333]|uniref:non-specific protein-tyrosine kinase n=1 Tax=Beutenbergia cavernae (strain ATCC BAA-8 / DSM 12333 / CCUG 43141 / JCM 11478 / NBRC 16432 / NCIMB 13614 / HKI 0122) TaxID=471853 RepID=C5C078_BEUC1|nr:polysaccharide biosynthesis tyrosine autokinase [Beutenbergia cavernae]ACQ79264.1 capsular exopolysaccharide family [Beutenbergia cavernae DSM 12333]